MKMKLEEVKEKRNTAKIQRVQVTEIRKLDDVKESKMDDVNDWCRRSNWDLFQ